MHARITPYLKFSFYIIENGRRNTTVDLVTRTQAERQRKGYWIPGRCKKCLSSPKLPDRL